MKQARIISWAMVVFAWLITSAHAQQDINTRQFTLAKVHFEGLKTIAADKAMTVTGLQTGQTVKLQHLQEAGQRMLDSGLFRSVSFRYKYQGEALEATFVVEESVSSLPCSFDNFPWFSTEELYAAIRRDLPNFDGKATEGGEMVEVIRKALERLLREHKLAGRIEHEMASYGSAHMFKVEDAKLPICAVTFDGATVFEASFLRGALQELFAYEYSRSINTLIARDRLMPLYRQKGYLKIRLKPAQGTISKEGECKEKVTVLLALEEGVSYQWNEPVWSGNQVIAKEVLQRRIPLKPGEVADGLKLDKGIQQIAMEYGEQGYFGLKLDPQPQFDDNARTVTYSFSIEEGPRYNLGTLTITGPSATQGQKLKEQWASIEGKPYEEKLVRQTLEKSGLAGRKLDLSTAADHEQHIVNLTLEIK